MQKITDEQKAAWTLACLAAPIVHTASDLYWLDAVWISLLGAGIRCWTTGRNTENGFLSVQRIIGILAAAQALVIMGDCWPKQKDMQWVLLILLMLAVLQAAKGEQAAIHGGLILWWLTAFLLGSVLLSAVPELKTRHWLVWSTERKWGKMLALLTLLLLPCLIGKEKKDRKTEWSLLLLPIVCSLAVQGVLGQTGSGIRKAAFYELSRSVRLYGILERMEAMAWLGLMLGTYLYMSFLLVITVGGAEEKKDRILLGIVSAGAAQIGAGILREEILGALLLAAILVLELLLISLRAAEKRKERKIEKHENNG